MASRTFSEYADRNTILWIVHTINASWRLAGEEVPLTNLAGMRKYYGEGVRHKHFPHVPLAMPGRLKHNGQERYHDIHYSGSRWFEFEDTALEYGCFKVLQGERHQDLKSFRNPATGAPAKQGDYEYAIL